MILAGDIHTKLDGLKWVPDLPVIYLLGKHEFYGAKLPRLIEKLKDAAAGSNVTILEKDSVEIGGYRFFGATLWTDMALHGDTPGRWGIVALKMNDYKRVRQSLCG